MLPFVLADLHLAIQDGAEVGAARHGGGPGEGRLRGDGGDHGGAVGLRGLRLPQEARGLQGLPGEGQVRRHLATFNQPLFSGRFPKTFATRIATPRSRPSSTASSATAT